MTSTSTRPLALLLAIMLVGAHTTNGREITRKGPYLALAPYTQAIHLDMRYLLADFETRTETEEWRAFWRWGLGWAFSQDVSLGFEHGSTVNEIYDGHHEYSTCILRARWFPAGGAWYATGGVGAGSAVAPLAWTPGYEYGTVYDTGWLVTLGGGYEIGLGHNLAVQLQADWMQQRSYSHEGQSGYRFDVDSWALGATLVWYP